MKAWSVTQINRYIKSMFVQDVLVWARISTALTLPETGAC